MIGIAVMLAACTGDADKSDPDDTAASGPGLVWNRELLACDATGHVTWTLPEERIAVVYGTAFLWYAGTETLYQQGFTSLDIEGETATLQCTLGIPEGFDATVEVSWAYWAEDVAAEQGEPRLAWHHETLPCDAGEATWMLPEGPLMGFIGATRHRVPGSGEVVAQSNGLSGTLDTDQGVLRATCTPSDIYDTEVEVSWATWGTDDGSEGLVWTQDAATCEVDGMENIAYWTVPSEPITGAFFSYRKIETETGEVVEEEYGGASFYEPVPVGERAEADHCGWADEGFTDEATIVWATWAE